MKDSHIKIYIGLLLLIANTAQAQTDSVFAGLQYKVESGIDIGKGDHSPLWLNANKQGLSSIEKNNGYIAAGIFKPMVGTNQWRYDYGLELAGASHFTSDVFVQQAYADIRYHGMQLSVGSKERYGELVDPLLSSGSLSFSGNARPIPQIRGEVPEYLPVPYTKGWLSFRGHVAYGWFTDGAWQKRFAGEKGNRTSGVLYHSKALYLKVEKPDVLPLRFECGLQMECQFGGTRYYSDGTKFGMPEGLKDYIKALIPMHGSDKSPTSDQQNIEGNMLGSYHFSLSYRVRGWEIRPYYEHYYEDQSMLSMKYKWRDGLVGLELTFPKNPVISRVVAEYFGSMDQSGPFFCTDKDGHTYIRMAGGDNYYNNGFYGSWSHWGMAIGNPLFMSPIYNADRSMSFRSNRITARHLGISGNPTKEWSYRILLSYTRNWGRYDSPYTDTTGTRKIVKGNTSTLWEMTYTPLCRKGWSFKGAFATDRGSMLGKNTGFMLTVCIRR